MKKTYITPTLNVENAMPESLLCESFHSNVGLEPGGASDEEARTQESAWEIWDGEE